MKTSEKLCLAWGAAFLCLLVSLSVGRYSLPLSGIIDVLFHKDGGMAANIFYNIRLVRCLEAALCGMALAVAGHLYQSGFHNALVSPDTLGVSGGASVGAIVTILYLRDSVFFRQVFSFAGGILAVLFSLLLSRFINSDRRVSLLLSGVICSALTNSMIMAFKYLADPTTQLAAIDYWLMGSFSLTDRSRLLSTALIAVPCLILTVLFRHRLKALLLQEDEAKTLGVDTKLLQFLCIGLSTLLTAACVSVSGIVSWIGLLAPHIVNVFFASSFEDTLLLCMPVGAVLLLVSDTLARSATMSEIPVSIITSFIGAAILFFFLKTKKGRP